MAENAELPDMEKDLDFATLAIAHRVLTREQLEEAERTINKEAEAGKPRRPVEDVLLEKGVLKSDQVWAVYKAKERLIRDARARGQRIGGYEIMGKLGEGGLGSNIAVLLARTGVGHLMLVDSDTVEPSNLN
ncbi:MAG: ThiF family adenylyltransferase, partial [Planctomycetes bacterium]|nr:ThiF family adenylyltransferase [Planctomycetota bacterium]